jgi:hypothetical protein
MRRAGILIAFMIAALILGRDACAQKSADSPENLIKAGLIYNFAIYVEWPAAVWANADSPIVIGVLGDDSFANTVADIVVAKKINNRKLVVRKLRWSKDARELKDCNMVFIAPGEAARGDDVIQQLKGLPILTVADFPDFTKHGGIIGLFLDYDKVRFEVNLEAAKQSDLTISSQMLIRARIVPTGSSWR